MKKIDAHFHVNLSGYNADDIVNYLDKNHIEKCWLLTWEEKKPPIPTLYNHLSIKDVINTYEKYPDRIIPFYAPDPASENVKEELEKYIKKGVKGCGELKVTYKWEDPLIERYLEVISDLNLPLIFHMEESREQYVPIAESKIEKLLEQLVNGALNGLTKYYLSKYGKLLPYISNKISKGIRHFPGYLCDFLYLEKRIKQFPNINFIGHGPGFWNNIASFQSPKYIHQKGKINEWGIINSLLEEYDNFYCDISGKSGFNALTRDKEKGKVFLYKHSDKILFGTDNTQYDFDKMISSYKLPKDKLENIYYNNANKLL